ncbi:U3 small nucleolar RNA-associated protein 14 homolog A [Anabrus simplex]|uniref:U3 small nucleolar RNA-associated protein 14 homolog A n=1 Tax=Anabrus simplex TaxID=316456 RepID=UPI0035A3064F
MTRGMEIEGEEMEHSDAEVSPTEHSKLLTAVSQLDNKQRVKPPSRKEPSLQVSEFHLVQSGEGRGNAVHLLDLAKALKQRSDHVKIGSKLKAIRRKGRTLPKPLEKPVAERIQRTVGFNKVRKQVSRWEPIVQKNRIADHLSFPLSQGRVSFDSSREFFKRFKTQSPLEAQVAEILNQSKCAQEDKEKAEKEFSLSLEELAERRKEMARLRLQQSYEAAKARRQGKIKSKKYHRVLRREKIRKQLKDFETLQKTDPEAALEQLQQIERTRAKERMTLRHRNTGQWARSRAVRAKYDPQSRQALAEQLAISRDLTKKLQTETDSSEEEDEGNEPHMSSTENKNPNDNPWITAEPELEAFVVGYRQYWEKHNKELAEKKKKATKNVENDAKAVSALPSTVNDAVELNNPNESHMSEPPSIQEGIDNHNCSGSGTEEELNRTDDSVCNRTSGNTVPDFHKKRAKFKQVLPSPGIVGEKSPSVKVSSKVKNVSRNTKELVAMEKYSEKIPLKKSIGTSPKATGVVDGVGMVEVTSVKGTSSWVVTPVKLTKGKKNDMEEKNKVIMLPEMDKNTRMKGTNRKLENGDYKENSEDTSPKINSVKVADNNYIHMDDIFDDMEQKLKQKVSRKLRELKNIKTNDSVDDRIAKEVEDVDVDGPSLEFKTKAKRPQEDLQLIEESGHKNNSSSPGSLSIPVVPKVSLGEKEASGNQKDDVDPNKFLAVKPKLLQTQFPDMVTGGEEGLDNEENEESQQMTITEAFTGDDVVAEFVKEKADEVEKSKPKDIDISLPGWGSWGGKNMPVNKRKKRRFIIKFPKAAPRKDENKGHLIINEDKETKILQHQVSDVPFPFTTVKNFEASIRAPIGNTWVPETAYRKLIEPQVKTKLGSVIQPMDEETLVSRTKKVNVV